ncbi:MAG TPA: RDD family protein [Dermatophilaceae bacterium]|nr:RDD family protein [Dermatophilaceae bacterium]
MVDREDVGSWLEGPTPVHDDDGFPGKRLGLPEAGPGSVARLGRRTLAIFVDWIACSLIAAGVLGYRLGEGGAGGFKPLLVFAVVNLLMVGTAGYTMGHRLFGMRVERCPRGYAGPVRALVRSALLCLAIPALIWDRDERGLHDRLAGTVVLCTR